MTGVMQLTDVCYQSQAKVCSFCQKSYNRSHASHVLFTVFKDLMPLSGEIVWWGGTFLDSLMKMFSWHNQALVISVVILHVIFSVD